MRQQTAESILSHYHKTSGVQMKHLIYQPTDEEIIQRESNRRRDSWEFETRNKMIRGQKRAWAKKYMHNGDYKSRREIAGPNPPVTSLVAEDLLHIPKKAVVQQNLAVSPPFPILDVGLEYILGQIGANATANGNASLEESSLHPRNFDTGESYLSSHTRIPLEKRVEGPIQCGGSQPCADGSCCNSVSLIPAN